MKESEKMLKYLQENGAEEFNNRSLNESYDDDLITESFEDVFIESYAALFNVNESSIENISLSSLLQEAAYLAEADNSGEVDRQTKFMNNLKAKIADATSRKDYRAALKEIQIYNNDLQAMKYFIFGAIIINPVISWVITMIVKGMKINNLDPKLKAEYVKEATKTVSILNDKASKLSKDGNTKDADRARKYASRLNRMITQYR